MEHTDKPRFKVMLEQTMSVYDKNVSESTLNIFWEALKQFDMKNVSACFEEYIHSNSYIPKPFDIVNLCRANITYEQKQLTHIYKPVSKEKAIANIEKIKDLLKGIKSPHPKKWVINILSDPNYKYGVGKAMTRKVYNELNPRELKELDPDGLYQNEV